MERKECQEKQSSAFQKKPPKNKLYFSYVLLNFHKKIIHIKCDYLKKRRNLFKYDLFLESQKIFLKE